MRNSHPRQLVLVAFLALSLAAAGLSSSPPFAAAERDPVPVLLEAVDAAELARWLAGEDPSVVWAGDGRTLRQILQERGVGLATPWFTVDGGGGEAAGGSLRLRGTCGQADAGVALGPEPSVIGGFWVDRRTARLFADGFESGSIGGWSSAPP